MKKTMVLSGIIVLALSFIMGISTANAAFCTTATITSVSASDTAPTVESSKYLVRVTCPANFPDERYFLLSAELGDSGYATVLTALSLGTPVKIFMGSNTSGSLLTKVQVLATP